MEPDFIGNKKFDAIDMAYCDPNLVRAPEHLMAPVVEPLQVLWKLGFLSRIMDDILFEIRAHLRDEIATLAIALEQIVHLGFHDLLDMRLFDIVGSNIQADTERSDDNYAEYRKGQGNSASQSTFNPWHGK
jgi:hypothetical protein